MRILPTDKRVRTTLLGGLVVVLLAAAPYAVDEYSTGLLVDALVLGLFAMSLNVLAGQTGLISLGHAGTFGAAAYGCAWLETDAGWGFVPAAFGAIATALVVSALFALTAARSTGVYFILVTLAQGMLVWGVVQRWTDVTGGDNGLRSAELPAVLGTYYGYYWYALAAVAISVVALAFFQRSSAGLRLRGVRESSLRMAALGFAVPRERFVAYLVSGFFAGVAGFLFVGHNHFISPSAVHVSASVEVLLVVIIGGMGSFLGPMVGAFVLVLGRAVITGYTERWHLVMGAILVIMVLVSPDGLVGRLEAAVRVRRRAAANT
jgi:branched-chain amino acid transport system permease protein